MRFAYAQLFALLGAISTFASPLTSNLVKRASRTSPPSGAVVVRQSGATSGQFTTVQAAVNSLPNDSSSRTIFIYPGTYNEVITISRSGPLTIYGSTTDTTSYTSNSVTIQASGSAASTGSDPTSATMQVNKANFNLYNVILRNNFGQGSQALAINANGDEQGYYGVAFYGYQDTVLAETGNQIFAHCYIEGAVDYIFGQHARAFITRSVIASVAAGTITANGRNSSSDVSFFVIDESQIIQSANAKSSLTGQVFLGRPWGAFSRAAFAGCSLASVVNGAGWEEWSSTMPNTADSDFIEFNNSGTGASGTRASFVHTQTSDSGLDIASILGSGYTSWVDTSYLT